MKLFTLHTIVEDLMNIIRGYRVTQSERISGRQVEAWVNEYRAILVKQDLDKGKKPNPDYIQILEGVQLEQFDLNTENIETDYFRFRSTYQLPKTLDLNHKSGILYISNIYGDEIQLIIEPRVNWQKYRRFTGDNKVAYIRDGHLYVHNKELLEFVNIHGVFEKPLDAKNFENINNGERLVTQIDFEYPIPVNKIPTLKEMILQKELGISLSAPSDNKNDSAHQLSGNVAGQAQS